MPFGQHNIDMLHAGKVKNHRISCSCLLPESMVSINPICSQRNKSKYILKTVAYRNSDWMRTSSQNAYLE